MTTEYSSGQIIVQSDTQEYIDLKILEAQGDATFLGERFLGGGVTEASFHIGPIENPYMTMGPTYFANALRAYSNWPMKWWRECVQNSVDAKARNIALNVGTDYDGNSVVSCHDDGKGMSRRILIDKFLDFSGTGKEEREGNVGGFGKAKEMLILPWLDWDVKTRDLHIGGVNNQWEHREDVGYTDGTELTVIMPADNATTTYAAMEYLQRCDLRRKRITINGQPFEADLKRGKFVRELEHGKLYHNKEAKTGRVYIRANGLFMFQMGWFDRDIGTLIFELTGDTTKILTDNRDGFAIDGLGDQLSAITSEIATEGKRALKRKEGRITEVWRGTGQIDTAIGACEVLQAIGPLPPVDSAGLIISKENADGIAGVLGAMLEGLTRRSGGVPILPATEYITQNIVHEPLKGASNVETLANSLVWAPDFMIHNDVNGLKIQKGLTPDGMTGRNVALAQVWVEACRWVFIQLGKHIEYGVGFCFSQDALAMCMEREEDGYWLLLNPLRSVRGLDQGGKVPLKQMLTKSSRDDMKALYARAIHEVTHMDSGYMRHDSAFAAALTENFAKCSDGFKVMWKIAQSVKAPKALPKGPKPVTRPRTAKKIEIEVGVNYSMRYPQALIIDDVTGRAHDRASDQVGYDLSGSDLRITAEEAQHAFLQLLPQAARDTISGGRVSLVSVDLDLLADLVALCDGKYTRRIGVDVRRIDYANIHAEVNARTRLDDIYLTEFIYLLEEASPSWVNFAWDELTVDSYISDSLAIEMVEGQMGSRMGTIMNDGEETVGMVDGSWWVLQTKKAAGLI